MSLKVYVVKKGLYVALTLFFVIMIIFFLVRLVPGDIAYVALGQDAPRAAIEAFRREMGLDRTLPEQFLILLSNLAHGKLGISGITSTDAMPAILYYLPATIELATLAMTVAIIFGILLGVTTGYTENKKVDNIVSFFAISGLSTPVFLTAIFLQVIVAGLIPSFPLIGRIEPGFSIHRVTGLMLIDTLLAGNTFAFVSALKCLALPTFTLALGPTAAIMRLVRANTIREKRKSYITTFKANGLPNSLLRWRYLLPNAISPALTVAGLQFANALGGSFVIETIFGFPGIGWIGVEAMIDKDINMIQGVTLFAAIFFLISNFVVDFLHSYIDPRIRLKEKAD